MQSITDTNVNPYANGIAITTLGYKLGVITSLSFLLMSNHRSTLNLNFDYFFSSILKPFLKDVIRDIVLNREPLERFPMRQSLGLVLKVKPFKIFAANLIYRIRLAAKVFISIKSHFLTAYNLFDKKSRDSFLL